MDSHHEDGGLGASVVFNYYRQQLRRRHQEQQQHPSMTMLTFQQQAENFVTNASQLVSVLRPAAGGVAHRVPELAGLMSTAADVMFSGGGGISSTSVVSNATSLASVAGSGGYHGGHPLDDHDGMDAFDFSGTGSKILIGQS